MNVKAMAEESDATDENHGNEDCWCEIWTNAVIRISSLWYGNEQEDMVVNSKTPVDFEVVRPPPE